MKSSKDKKVSKKPDYKVVSFILFTVSFFTIFAIRPSLSLIYTLQKEKAEYEQVNKTLEDKIQQIISTQAQFMELINNKDLVEQALPDTHQVEKTREFLNKDIKVNSFSIQKITILPKSNAQLSTVTINLNGAGNYEDLQDFLDYIDNSRRLISINYLDLISDPGATVSAQINFNTVLNTFYYLEEI
ncbi:hypothetical protein A2209_00405 [Candidatus Roizmanbacteria bacterium RIFOXYA1_FULL_41_12]|uniref:Type 4 fimbrial biogenesis protein PilO n=1 Tax=Candidatus Roizmanbacteria bacterium RIFOXYA1_FULL_41_12 TaxID=1802082 RepID=A0A1F7KB01_9BACT|nr:MAG: hypothetical protein A2209_00405 [Candidatus Roizmanbacteria bacterium RIFOXYA1_FULL_41_12]OGK66496.1 MAG: hypothetical protein A2262_02395 [Candidatus Roizmanbacteria bacterium RIFOXYA2_FULL_41_8]OGK66591.1 MAG: hypothetical protein A2377_00180 [Candidatus Roizmanbacteria bacterium RIFOXYB1_FULL_41_27]OGK72292.1 MAG: hypothetical protein A2403_00020 [Candidatus Roizmanbacteria bacterium RIFOXYC1_FULL_41_16]OGK75290.1 MAG: hypothetical protein A2575_01735 [Candidatus Roizmanbacteria bac